MDRASRQPGRVRVATGKVEIGQGILTALTQIAAEELDVAPEQVRLVSGETDVSPAEGFTSGSYSIAVGGASIRLVCAEVRALFLDRLAETLRCPVARAVDRGRTSSCAPARTPAATTGRSRARSSSSAARAAPRRPSCRRPIASSARNLPRIDLPAKLAGAAFIHDIAPDERGACARAAAAVARRASCRARRGRRAPRRQGADRHPARGRLRRLHGGERDRGDARGRSCPHARALGRRRAGPRRHRRAGLAQGAARARPHGRDRASPAAPARAAWSKRATRGPS